MNDSYSNVNGHPLRYVPQGALDAARKAMHKAQVWGLDPEMLASLGDATLIYVVKAGYSIVPTGSLHTRDDHEEVPTGTRGMTEPTYMHNEPAVGAPKNWKYGYLPCGCRNDGFGRHVR